MNWNGKAPLAAALAVAAFRIGAFAVMGPCLLHISMVLLAAPAGCSLGEAGEANLRPRGLPWMACFTGTAGGSKNMDRSC